MDLLKSRFRKMLALQTFGTLITFIDRYGSVPILTYFWGLSVFGEWLLMRIVPICLSMFEEGFPAAAGNHMVALVAKGKWIEARNIYTITANIMYIISGLILCILAASLVWGMPHKWLNIEMLSAHQVSITLCLICVNIICIFQKQLLYAAYRAEQQQVYWNFVMQITRLCEFLSVAFLAVIGGDVIMIAAGITFVSFCGAVFLQIKAYQRLKILSIKPSNTSLHLAKSLLKPSGAFILMPLAQMLNLQGFIWLIGFVISPTMAAIFTIYRTYSRIICHITDIICRALWPELTAYYFEKNIQKFAQLLLNSILSVIIIGFIGSVICYYYADVAILYWTLGKVESDSSIISLLLITAYLGIIRHVVFMAATSINQHTSLVVLEICINLIALSYIYILGHMNFLMISFTLIMVEAIIAIFVFIKARSIIQNHKNMVIS